MPCKHTHAHACTHISVSRLHPLVPTVPRPGYEAKTCMYAHGHIFSTCTHTSLFYHEEDFLLLGFEVDVWPIYWGYGNKTVMHTTSLRHCRASGGTVPLNPMSAVVVIKYLCMWSSINTYRYLNRFQLKTQCASSIAMRTPLTVDTSFCVEQR